MSEQPYPMNRAQRRAHYREAKKDEISVFCPRCNHKTRHVALPEDESWAKTHRDDPHGDVEKTACKVVCVACGNAVRHDMNLVPYTYVKVSA